MKASLKRLASVSNQYCSKRPEESILTVTVAEADGQCLSLRFAFTDICSNVPNPTAITADIGRELHVRGH